MKTKVSPKKTAKKALKKPAKRGPKPAKSADTGTPDAAEVPSGAAEPIRKESVTLVRRYIVPSPDNRSIAAEDLDPDFIQSIRTYGILEPLWVRELAHTDLRFKKGATHELIAGERRWCASGVAGLEEVPVTIFYCTESQADELRVIENLHRLGLTELEEGRAYARLVEKHGYSVRDDKHPERSLVHKLSKSESFIHGRIKLIGTPKLVQEALAAGSLAPSVALRIARISDPKAQVAAAADILRRGRDDAPMSDKEAGEFIARNYTTQLKGAPFDTKDATLYEIQRDPDGHRIAGGACTDCPLRSGNQSEMFAEDGGTGRKGRGDMCLNPGCYKQKADNAWAWAVAVHHLSGGVTSTEAAETIFSPYGQGDTLPTVSRYVFPSDICHEDPQRRTFATLLEVDGKPPVSVVPVLVRSRRTGAFVTLWIRAEVKAAITAAGHLFFEEKKEAEKAGNAEELMITRARAILAQQREWRLAFLIDWLRGRSAVLPIIYRLTAESLAIQSHSSGENALSSTLSRWTPMRPGRLLTVPLAHYLDYLNPIETSAFMLELALRRMAGGIPAFGMDKVITDLAEVCQVPIQDSETITDGFLAQARDQGLEIKVLVSFDELRIIGATPRYVYGKGAKSFLHEGRHYVRLDARGQDLYASDNCWEMVPLAGYDGTPQAADAPITHDKRGNIIREGQIVRQRGLDYALRGPRLSFIQRSGQCAQCGITELERLTDGAFIWSDAAETLCAPCAAKTSL